jgi:hypothetical protein
MIPRKKRQKYKKAAWAIMDKAGLPRSENWEDIWKILDSQELPTFLYAFVDNKNKLVKFGKSQNPVSRLGTVRTDNAMDIKLAGYCPHEEPMTEKIVHAKLKAYRVSGEWFRICDETNAVIKEIQGR